MSAPQSILLITNQPNVALQRNFGIDLTVPHLDMFVLESDKSIGIDLVREVKLFAQTRPVIKPRKHVIIPQADRLTQEAQNALLKILEEPPPYLVIILAINNVQQLLDTIISRCQIITDQLPISSTPALDSLTPLLQRAPTQRLDALPPTTTKEAALSFCNELLMSAAHHLRTNPSTETSHNLDILLSCQTHLTQNANPTLAVTDAVLSLLPLPANPATMAQLPE